MSSSRIFFLALVACFFAATTAFGRNSKTNTVASTKLKSLFGGKCLKPDKVQEIADFAANATTECNVTTTSKDGKPYVNPCDELCLLEKFSVVKRSGNTTFELDLTGTKVFTERIFVTGFADALLKNLKDCSERRAISSTFEGSHGDNCKDALSHIRCIRKQMEKTCKAVMSSSKKTAG